jgi:hypothetical protein
VKRSVGRALLWRTPRHPFAAERLQDDLVAGSLGIRF